MSSTSDIAMSKFVKVILLLSLPSTTQAFVSVARENHAIQANKNDQALGAKNGYYPSFVGVLHAKPKRLDENVPGVVYVNDKCINCAACSNFCPESFARSENDQYHFVYHQPENLCEIDRARAALTACPVAAIRLETKAEKRHAAALASGRRDVEVEWTEDDQSLVDQMTSREATPPFPRPFLQDIPGVYWIGHNNAASFGATSYLVQAHFAGVPTWIMVDVPRYSKQTIEAIRSICPDGPKYLFLSHVDDTAHHDKWALEFPGMKRILHSLELDNNWVGDKELESCEVLLEGETESRKDSELAAFRLDGTPLSTNWRNDPKEYEGDDVVLLHTPGHSPGSITLYKLPNEEKEIDGSENVSILFTGDTYAFTTRHGGHMSGLPRYGHNLRQQAHTLEKLVELDWDVIAPGHGHPRDYRVSKEKKDQKSHQSQEMKVALDELVGGAARMW